MILAQAYWYAIHVLA